MSFGGAASLQVRPGQAADNEGAWMRAIPAIDCAKDPAISKVAAATRAAMIAPAAPATIWFSRLELPGGIVALHA